MTSPHAETDRQDVANEQFGGLFEQIAEQLRRGERIDVAAYQRRYPENAAQIVQLLPTLEAMVALGQSGDSTKKLAADAEQRVQHKTLGDFRIIRELGRGGMGVVYEAQQISMGRKVALKVLPLAALAQERGVQRFHNEVRAAAALDHPNIVAVYSVGEERGVHYYAMRLIRGQTLAAVIAELAQLQNDNAPLTGNSISQVLSSANQQGTGSGGYEPTEPYVSEGDGYVDRPSATESDVQARVSTVGQTEHHSKYFRSATQLGVQAADALQHAHDHGVVHRDIKPGNFMLDAQGQLYITDFGLARIESDVGLTMTGDLVGTLRYMSPEQAMGKRVVVDHRCDIYSLGVTLYELFTLRPPFDGANRQELLRQIAFEDPPKLRKINRSIPAELQTIVLKAIEKDPDQRYNTVGELADDLRAFLEDRPIKAKPATMIQLASKWTQRNKAVVITATVAMFLLLLGGAAMMWWSLDRESTLRVLAESRAHEAKQFAEEAKQAEAREANARIEAERSAVEAESARNKEAQARADAERHLSEVEAQRREVYRNLYKADMRLAAVDWAGGNTTRLLRTLTNHLPDDSRDEVRGWEWYYLLASCRQEQATMFGHMSQVNGVAWSPDRAFIATVSDDGCAKVWDSKTLRTVRTFHGSMVYKRSVAWSPDSSQLAWCSVGDENAVRIWDVPTDEVRVISGHQHSIMRVVWSPDGRVLASCSMDHTVKLWDSSSGECIRTLDEYKRHIVGVCWSPDGETLVAGGNTAADGLKVWNPTTGELIDSKQMPVSSVAWSPDGKRVAVGSQFNSVLLLNTKTWQRELEIEAHAGQVCDVAWNGDGSLLASAGADGLIHLWDADGQKTRTLRGHRGRVNSIAWDPDGTRLVSGGADGETKIWKISGDKSRRTLHHQGGLRAISWTDSPGQLACIGKDRTTVVRDTQNGDIIRSNPTPAGQNSAYSRDGRFLARAASSDGVSALVIESVAAGTQLGMLRTNAGRNHLKWSPDGSLLAATWYEKPSHGICEVWNVKQNRLVCDVGPISGIHSVSWSSDGRHLALAGTGESTDGGGPAWAGFVYVIDITSGRRTFKLSMGEHNTHATCVAWNTEGTRLVAGNEEGVIRAWDSKTGKTTFSSQLHTAAIKAVDWSPDGRRIASAGQDQRVRVLDAVTAEELIVFPIDRELDLLAWSSDSKSLAAASKKDGTIRIWAAATDFESGNNGNPDSRLYFAKAVFLADAGQCGEAIDQASRSIELNPDWFRAYLTRAESHFNLGQWSEAIADYSRLFELTSEVEFLSALNLRGICFRRIGEHDKAIADFDRFCELCPSSHVVWSNLSSAHNGVGQHKKAIEAASKAIEIDADYLYAFRNRAEAFCSLRQWDSALDDFARLIELQPDTAIGYYWQTLCLLARDPNDVAAYGETCATMLKRFQDGDEQVKYWSIWTASLSDGSLDDYEIYVQMSEQLLSSGGDANNSRNLNTLGAILYRAGRYEEAVRRLQEAIDSWDDSLTMTSSPAYTWFLLAMAQQKLAHTQEAQQWLSKAVEQADQELADDATSWNRRLTLELFRDEATELIVPK